MEHVLPSLIRRQWKASVVQRDPSGNLFPRVPESPTQKEVWNLSSCPQPASYRTPAPALGHNLQSATVSLQGPSPTTLIPAQVLSPRQGGPCCRGGGECGRFTQAVDSRCEPLPPSGLLAGLPWQADSAVCWRGCLQLPCSGWRGSGWQQLPLRGCLRRADRGCESWHGRGSVCERPHSAAG